MQMIEMIRYRYGYGYIDIDYVEDMWTYTHMAIWNQIVLSEHIYVDFGGRE